MSMSKKILIFIILLLVISPGYIAKAATETKVTVYCNCDRNDDQIDCSKNCSLEDVEESIKVACGGRNSEIIEANYYCNRKTFAFIPIDDDERSGSSPLEACQNYYQSVSAQQDNLFKEKLLDSLKVTAKATCEPVSETLGEFICQEDDVLKALSFVGYLLFFVKLLVPFIIILMGTMDFYQSVVSDKPDELNKYVQKFMKRIILGILVFFIPTILNTFMTLVSDYSEVASKYEDCIKCALKPTSCNN